MGVRAGCWLLALTALLGACSSEEPPGALPPVALSGPSPSREPAPSAPPLEAMNESSAGASAFARFFVLSIGTAFATANPALIAEHSATGCGGCDALIASAGELRSLGHRRIGGDYLDISAVSPAVVDGEVVVSISYRRSEGRVVDASGATISSAPPVPQTNAQMRLSRSSDIWLVKGYRTVG